MRLFYLSEHRSCFNYQLRYESGFSRYELTAHEEGRIDNDGCFCVLFVLKGEVLVELGRSIPSPCMPTGCCSYLSGKRTA